MKERTENPLTVEHEDRKDKVMRTTMRPDGKENGPRCPLTGLPVAPKTGRILNPNPKGPDSPGYPSRIPNAGEAVAEALRRGLEEKEAKRAGNPDDAKSTPSDSEPNL